MRIHVLHDQTGRIRGTAVAGDGVEGFGVSSSKCLRVLTLDRPGMREDAALKFLADLHASHRVRLTGAEPTLVKIKRRPERPKKDKA